MRLRYLSGVYLLFFTFINFSLELEFGDSSYEEQTCNLLLKYLLDLFSFSLSTTYGMITATDLV